MRVDDLSPLAIDPQAMLPNEILDLPLRHAVWRGYGHAPIRRADPHIHVFDGFPGHFNFQPIHVQSHTPILRQVEHAATRHDTTRLTYPPRLVS
ncbi:hypothetical protein [Bifidobacterium eulemuris]|uniref:hypothetical protein n=1 Tax=Bifidobacterium eulemuris TaxID=1765219 RepID=UPI001FCF0761|nr:hypothetical protein [Bifidobacterium eulemuris]